MTIIAAADGSALGNPGPAGWAWYIDESSWRAGGWDHGTNNMGELTAVLNLLESTRHIAEEPLKILCDSQYVINSVTKWMPGWKKKGWKKKDGKPVLNVDIMKALDREMAGRTVEFEWVKGHAGHELNEAADDRARAMATAFQAGDAQADMPVGPGFRNSDGSVQAAPAPTTAPASTPNPASTPAPASAPRREPLDEPDLFSELWDAEADSVLHDSDASDRITREAEPAQQILTLEAALLKPGTAEGPRRELLHDQFEYVARDGSVNGAQQFVTERQGSDADTAPDLSLSSAVPLGSTAYHHSYRLTDSSTVTRRSSLWIREDHHNEMGPWLLRYHQVTTEN